MILDRSRFLLLLLVGGLAACGGGIAKPTPFMRGNLLLDEGRPEAALLAYDEALAEQPENFRVLFNIASAHHDVFLREEPRTSAKALAAYERALKTYDRVLELSPGNARAVSSRAVLIRDGGSTDEAIKYLKDSSAEGDEGRVLPLWTLGTLYRDAGEEKLASESFAKALEENDEHVPSIVALAQLQERSGDLDAAEETVQAGLALAPFDLTLVVLDARLAVARARMSGDSRAPWELARKRLMRANQAAPEHWWIADSMAMAQERLGEFESAVKWLWKARDLASPRNLEQEDVDHARWHAEAGNRLLALYPRLMEAEGRKRSS